MRNIKNGVAIVCDNSEDISRLESRIKNSASLKDNIHTKQPANRHPSILYNLPEEMTIEKINEALRTRAGISEDLKLRFKLTGRQTGTAHWVMEASSDSFHKIKKLGKIPINWSMYQVREFFHIKRCNKCQGFRHLAKDCPKNRPVCGSCAGNHETRRCRSPHVVCINCAMHNQLPHQPLYGQPELLLLQGRALLEAASKFNPKIIIAQEPYILEGKISGIPRSWKHYTSKNQKAEIIILPTCSKPVLLSTQENSTTIKIQTNKGPLNIISTYSSPNENIQEAIHEIDQIIDELKEEKIIIGADWNAHNRLRGYSNEDTRGSQVEDFLLAKDLFLQNDANSLPTFEHNSSKGWPDLTITKGTDITNSTKWSVSEFLLP
ncbi:hypothetical protein HNY73_009947 [Argiope bruennichi]|uniref:Endonuclease/exonuclease/phosphatase domain-containing protein n=1 Tax=Argiope bruennichi TaxID=94029 RepID=A0A8T0F9I2_ARGBR|nr:hypothetical protein HNY73_009947 [Argiope bruennichi]